MSKPPAPPPAAPPAKATAVPPKPAAPALDDEALYFDFAELSLKMAKRPRIVFFGRTSFSDNTKYLFLAAAQAGLEAEVVWCTWCKPLYAQLVARGIRAFDLSADFRQTCTFLLEASVAVFCENPATALALSSVVSGCLAGAEKIQLWHGISVKHLDLMLIPHLDVRSGEFRRQLRFASRVDAFLSTSSALDRFWGRAFGSTKLIRAGQPRNEVIVRSPSTAELIGSELPPELVALLDHPHKRKLLLTPTWQRGTPLYVSTPAFYQRLARWAEAHDGVVVVKAHPFLRKSELPEDIPGRVAFLGAGVDLYPWLARFDAMITDYSSIMFDFLLTGKPVFTFNSRTQVSYGFEPDYSLVPPGHFRYEFDAANFDAVLGDNLTAHPLQSAQRDYCNRIFETPAAEACATLIAHLAACSHARVNPVPTVIHPLGAASAPVAAAPGNTSPTP
jgi:CDP-glycerol glycerophosphotransferase